MGRRSDQEQTPPEDGSPAEQAEIVIEPATAPDDVKAAQELVRQPGFEKFRREE